MVKKEFSNHLKCREKSHPHCLALTFLDNFKAFGKSYLKLIFPKVQSRGRVLFLAVLQRVVGKCVYIPMAQSARKNNFSGNSVDSCRGMFYIPTAHSIGKRSFARSFLTSANQGADIFQQVNVPKKMLFQAICENHRENCCSFQQSLQFPLAYWSNSCFTAIRQFSPPST